MATGSTPAQVEFGRGMLPDAGGDPNTVRPDPGATNNNFGSISIPREYDFDRLPTSNDLIKSIPNKNDAGHNKHTEAISIGDLWGTEGD